MLTVLRNTVLVGLDIAAALGMIAVVGYAAIDASTPGGITEPAWVSLSAATLIGGPVATRRWIPFISLAVSVVAAVAAMMSGVIPVVAMGAPVSAVALVLYLLASETTPRRSLLAFGGCLTLLAIPLLTSGTESTSVGQVVDRLFGITFATLLLVTAGALGIAARERRRRAAESATLQTEQAVAEERLRIARELHDIVAHSMSLIAVKAGIGNHVAEQRPAEAREALRVIEATSRSSLAEMRHLLGVLRSETDSPGRAPAPGPAGIPALVERARSAGVATELSLGGTEGLPEGVGLSVYRIVQEALTNVVRHAAPTRCEVDVAVSREAVQVEVVNDGPRVAVGQSGHGLIGMRERVVMYGGTFAAGPRHEGGWRVSAVLPLELSG